MLRGAIQERVIKRSDGRRPVSPAGDVHAWIFDFREIILDSKHLKTISHLLLEKLGPYAPFQVGGLETAAIPLVSGLVLEGERRGMPMSGFYVRKSRDKDGMQNVIEGIGESERVVLIDDLMNSGKGIERAVEVLEAAGKQVAAICVIVQFREDDAYPYFGRKGIPVLSLFRLSDFPSIKLPAPKEKKRSELATFSRKWRFAGGVPNFYYVVPKSGPVLDEEKVYFGADDGTMWAVEQGTGNAAWKYRVGFGSRGKYIFSSPALARGMLFFGAYDGNVYALDAATGEERWRFMDADWVGSSPAVAEDLGLVFVGLEFGLWNKRGAIVALDMETGKKKWEGTTAALVHASPAYSRRHGIVVCGSNDGMVYGLDARTGAIRWSYACGDAVKASCAFDEERGLAAFGSFDRFVHILDVRTGKPVHKVETLHALYSTPLIHDGRLYIGGMDKYVYAIDLEDGRVRWRYRTDGRIFASPAVIDDRLYIGCNDGRLYELELETGELCGYFQATERILNRIAWNPATERIFLPTQANELYCLEKARQPSARA